MENHETFLNIFNHILDVNYNVKKKSHLPPPTAEKITSYAYKSMKCLFQREGRRNI